MAPYLRLLRPGNVAMSAVAVGIGGVVAAGIAGLQRPGDPWNWPLSANVAWAALAAALFTGAGNVLNDYFDRETDRVNHPDRPIPSGEVGPKEARRFAITLFLVSFVLLGNAGAAYVLLAAVWWFNLAAMVSYEWIFKDRGLSGNVLIAYLVASLFLFGGLTTVPSIGSAAFLRTGVLALLAGVTTLGREIVKDIEDIAGDVNRLTLPMRLGVRGAAAAAAGCFGIGVGLSVLPWAWRLLGIGYAAVVVADGMFIYAALVSARQPRMSQRAAKYAMVAALATFLLGGLT